MAPNPATGQVSCGPCPLQLPSLRPPLSPARPQGKNRPMVFRGGGGGGCSYFSMLLSLPVCLLFGHLPRRVGATQRYPPRSRRLCCRGRGAHPFHTEQNREPSAAVALLLWRVLAQGSTTWEPRRGPTWAGHRPEGSVGGGLLATHGWRVFGFFVGAIQAHRLIEEAVDA